QKEPFSVVVDYAHTPDSLAAVYKTLRERHLSGGGGLICVLGAAGGGRDKWKRPEMGKIAAENCDEIILTDEDPYDEDSGRILAEIKSGIQNASFPIQNAREIINREEAIEKAVGLAKAGDVVVITGKGSEPWMHLEKKRKIPWSDREAVLKALESKKNNRD
ncbi:MAG: cyanophycin synthetase, partial [Patescibacteria group bacterium]